MNDQIEPIASPPSHPQKKANILLRIWRGIASIFRFLRVTIANILMVVLFIVVLGFLFSGPTVNVESDSVLVFTPSDTIVEKKPTTNPLMDLFFASVVPAVTDVHDVIATINHAAKNPRIIALEIRPDGLSGISLIHLELIGEAVQAFADTGKPVYAYSDDLGQSSYLLSSYADATYLNPLGSVSFSGIAFESTYYKSILDKLDVTVHTFRSGEYKSAVEPYMMNSMSEIVRASYRPIIDQLWDAAKTVISENREINELNVDQFTEQFGDLLNPGRKKLSELAIDFGFVDQLVTADTLSAAVNDRFGLNIDDETTTRISTEDYFSTIEDQTDLRVAITPEDSLNTQTKRRGRIAVITVEGTIFGWASEDSGEAVDSTGAIEHLQLALDEDVDAVVLRINSPGGLATVAEAMRLRVEEVQSHGIPVVVSMSNTAASGGYWIAAGADHIVAADSTITGSIGVFSMLPTVEKLLERIGVTTDGVYSTDNHFRMDPMVGISETTARMLQASVDDIYDRFLDIVSVGRNLSKTEVDAIAGGRIWTGRQALANGLIDQVGDYNDALEVAASLAGLKTYTVERYGFVERPPFLNLLAKASHWTPQLSPQSSNLAKNIRDTWQEVSDQLQIEPKKIYALCEFCPSY